MTDGRNDSESESTERGVEIRPDPTSHTGGISPLSLFLWGMVAQVALHWLLPVARLVAWPWTLIGLVPLAMGLAVMIRGERQFKKTGTPVQPGSDPTTLVTSGVFSRTRNPMYLGIVLVLVGVAGLLGTLSPFVSPLVIGPVLSVRFIRREEASLRSTFGDAYDEYRDEVPRWL